MWRNATCVGQPKKWIYLWHIHKSAGTTFCEVLRANGLCTPVARSRRDTASFFGKNCNPSILDASQALSGNPESMDAYVQKFGIDAYANEWFLAGTLPVRVAHLVVVMRDPVARTFSHCGSKREPKLLMSCGTQPKFINFITTRLVYCADEWRSTLSFKAPDCAGGGIDPYKGVQDPEKLVEALNTTFALDVAKRRLDLFGTILIVERLHLAAPILRATFGWTVLDTNVHRRGTNQATQHHVQEKVDIAAVFAQLNYNDRLLYAYAVSLFEGQHRAAIEKLQAPDEPPTMFELDCSHPT